VAAQSASVPPVGRQAKLPFVVRERHGDPSGENLLVHGDNLAAMEWLEERLAGEVACVYLDPPFNTGRTFAEYRDARAPDEWLAMMRPRLAAALPLLRDDGALFVEIDDTMVADLQRLMDDVVGRSNRVCTVTTVRSASTGHKAKNRGPINVTDFLLVYEKKRGGWRYRPQVRVRPRHDPAYGLWVPNAGEPCEGWRFEPLAPRVATDLGYPPRALQRVRSAPMSYRGASAPSRWPTPARSRGSRSPASKP
jgi:adenine-specific DNA-methyltransferase